jgi:hypothetical protein
MKMKSLVLFTVAVLFALSSVSMAVAQDKDAPAKDKAPAKAAGHDYAGIGMCKMCHSKDGIYAVWEKTGHAKATSVLGDKKDPKCYACHATGFGKTGGYDPAAADAAKKEGVTCEACHGPGKDYKGVMKDKEKAKAAGLIMPDAATCKACHEGATPEGHKELAKFDYAAMAKKIEHHVKPPAPAPAK